MNLPPRLSRFGFITAQPAKGIGHGEWFLKILFGGGVDVSLARSHAFIPGATVVFVDVIHALLHPSLRGKSPACAWNEINRWFCWNIKSPARPATGKTCGWRAPPYVLPSFHNLPSLRT